MLSVQSTVRNREDGCGVATTHIHRLPPEVLCDAFTSCSHPNRARGELHDVAKYDLLQLSKVCSHWHTLVMGTPSLWCDISLDCDRWPVDATIFLDLLEIALKRGTNHPLSLGANLTSTRDPVRGAVLALLAKHSWRLRHLDLALDKFSHLEDLAHIEGKLDFLQMLSLRSRGQWIEGISIFQTAPRLTCVSFAADDRRFHPRLPWNQLRSFTYDAWYTTVMELPASLDLLRDLSHPDAAFELRGFHAHSNWPVSSLDLPVTSTIASFVVQMDATLGPQHAMDVLSKIFRRLTLPNLRELRCLSTPDTESLPPFPIFWPSERFDALSLRSSFHATLRILDMHNITITEDDLVNSLAHLASLESLFIADQRAIIRYPDHILVGDTLLQRLTLTPDHSLVPRLKHLDCTSFFKFDAQVYFDFVASRVVLGTTPFHCVLRYFTRVLYSIEPLPPSELDPDVRQKLHDLVATGGLQFQLEEEIPDTVLERKSAPYVHLLTRGLTNFVPLDGTDLQTDDNQGHPT
ncbi:hypothetical protein C8R43DRAFT_1195168 [Mycena crocata]|nr:hypothetical protein C8R43DRAFT_1195168 [Mycena crocata]